MSLLPNMTLIADSLGWAVLHSLWQGMVAAGIVFTVRNLTRERASELRYFTGIVTLFALLCAFIGTFLYYYNTGIAANGTINGSIMNTAPAMDVAFSEPTAQGTVQSGALMRNPLTHLADFTGIIGLFWTICFAILGVRYLSAFRLTHKLRHHGLSDLPMNWQARFTFLVETSGVSPKIRAYFSEHVSSPITFGFLKPIILLPAWFFTSMTAEQCEAVILHELAHIRRHDYLTNILQIIIKTVFFYHPAVGFICKGLDTDREHACDDFAVMLTKNPESLATALGTIRLKAARGGGVFALSADGHDTPLMHRLKRLMGTASSKTGGISLEKGTSRGIAATAMMGTALALVMTLGATASQAHPQKQAAEDIKLAGECETCAAEPNSFKSLEKRYKRLIEVNGEIYKAGEAEINALNKITTIGDSKDNTYYIIKGKKYPSKYTYSLFSKDGKTFVVKQKNGKRYMEIDGNWYRVDKDKVMGAPTTLPTPATPNAPQPPKYAYGHQKIGTQSYATKTNIAKNQTFIKVRGTWHDIEASDLDTLLPGKPVAPPATPRPPVTSQYSYDYTLGLAEEAREAAQEAEEEVREAMIERAEDAREAAQDAREDALEDAWENQREAAQDRREAAREREIEQKMAAMERKLELKQRYIERAQQRRERDIERIERKIRIKEKQFEDRSDLSPGKIGQWQDEIGRLQGEIGRLQGQNGFDQGELGQLQGKLGHLQGELGRIQGKRSQDLQKKHNDMREKLIPELMADGFMKSKKNKVTVEMTPSDIWINGKHLDDKAESKYCNILSQYGLRKNSHNKIVIEPDLFSVKNGDSTQISLGTYRH